MRVIQAIALSALLGGTTLACSIPVIAVVAHKRDVKEEPNFAAVDPRPDEIRLYNKHGIIIARCRGKSGEDEFIECVDREGRDVTDLMNAWYSAFRQEMGK